MSRQFSALDGLRGVAALAVVTLHADILLGGHRLPGAFLAVDFFFALSGFVLAHAYGERLAAGTLSFADFMRARFIRLYPLYALGSAIGLVVILLTHSIGNHVGTSPAEYVVSTASAALFLPSPMSFDRNAFPLNFAAWSLFYELVANVLFALIARRLSNRVLAAILILGAGLLVATGAYFGRLDVGVATENFLGGGGRVLYGFFAGVAVHRLWASGMTLRKVSLAVPFLGLFVTMLVGERLSSALLGALLLAPAVVYLGAHVNLGAAGQRICDMLGRSSYALYVVHLPIITVVVWTMAALDFPPTAARPVPALALLVGLTILSLTLERWFDRPVRAFIARSLAVRTRRGVVDA